MHSACTKPRCGGLLVAIRETVADGKLIRWKDPVPGRLMMVRCVVGDQQVDLVNLYQHAWSVKTAEQNQALVQKRASFWSELDRLLSALPWRSTVVLAGDFNAVLRQEPE